jgi:hypothetical protein
MYSIYFIKKTEQSETILRNSPVLQFAFPWFCSLPQPLPVETLGLNEKDTQAYNPEPLNSEPRTSKLKT